MEFLTFVLTNVYGLIGEYSSFLKVVLLNDKKTFG
jgi:hypothetical protein